MFFTTLLIGCWEVVGRFTLQFEDTIKDGCWFARVRPPNLLSVLVAVELGDGTFELDQDAVAALDGPLPVVVY